MRNAAAAAAVALYLNVPSDLIREGMAKFSGVGRRFDVKGVVNGITVVDDYGHHPVEIRATLEAARGSEVQSPAGSVSAAPLIRARKHLWDDFCRAFNQADILVLTDIYAASEQPIPGVTSEALAKRFARPGTRMSSISRRCRRASNTC